MDEIILDKKLTSEKFENLFKSLYELLKRYQKDYKSPDSWVVFYSEAFGIKFPSITFNECHSVFVEKVIKVLDLMELSHLYCKVSNSKNYNKDNHQAVISTKNYIFKALENIILEDLNSLQEHLKHSILHGNN